MHRDCLPIRSPSFNRTNLELKLHRNSRGEIYLETFNRTNLELKHRPPSDRTLLPPSFNRTNLELKPENNTPAPQTRDF